MNVESLQRTRALSRSNCWVWGQRLQVVCQNSAPDSPRAISFPPGTRHLLSLDSLAVTSDQVFSMATGGEMMYAIPRCPLSEWLFILWLTSHIFLAGWLDDDGIIVLEAQDGGSLGTCYRLNMVWMCPPKAMGWRIGLKCRSSEVET